MRFGKQPVYQYGQKKKGFEACAYHYTTLMSSAQCVMEKYLGYLSALIEPQIGS